AYLWSAIRILFRLWLPGPLSSQGLQSRGVPAHIRPLYLCRSLFPSPAVQLSPDLLHHFHKASIAFRQELPFPLMEQIRMDIKFVHHLACRHPYVNKQSYGIHLKFTSKMMALLLPSAHTSCPIIQTIRCIHQIWGKSSRTLQGYDASELTTCMAGTLAPQFLSCEMRK